MNSAVLFVWCAVLLGLIATTGARVHQPRFCYLPPVTGHCRASKPRWYYNYKTRACEPFTYGGCGGNRNRFDTEVACHVACRPMCWSVATCKLQCRRSGRYADKNGCPVCRCVDQCEEMKCSFREQCEVKTHPCLIPPCPTYPACVDMCRQYSDQGGHGHASITRWRSESKIPRIEGQINLQCTKFTYGGYGGNMNNFKSKKECETWCLCPVAKCEKECEYGYRFDGSGCPSCECLVHPCAAMLCMTGSVCVPLRIPVVPCTGMNCPPRAVCAKVPRCRRRCRFGYAMDENLRFTCECLDNPCAFTICPPGTHCVPRTVLAPCQGFGCPARAKCVKDTMT